MFRTVSAANRAKAITLARVAMIRGRCCIYRLAHQSSLLNSTLRSSRKFPTSLDTGPLGSTTATLLKIQQ